jgi:hypothetical protein
MAISRLYMLEPTWDVTKVESVLVVVCSVLTASLSRHNRWYGEASSIAPLLLRRLVLAAIDDTYILSRMQIP